MNDIKIKFGNFIKNNYIYILTNVFIMISYLCILTVVGFHGIDDYNAITFHFTPDKSLDEIINDIQFRITQWNCRLGEILYFVLGTTNKYVIFIAMTLIALVFFNLTTRYVLGKSKFRKNNYTSLCLLLVYFITLLIFPALTETFFWVGGLYNHLLSLVLILIILLPYRDYLDNLDTLNKSDAKYILYLILCFISGFGSEATVGTAIISMAIVNFVIFVKNKRIDKYKLFPFVFLALGYILFLNLSQRRIIIQASNDYALYTRENILREFLCYREIQIILFLTFTIIYFVINRKNNLKQDIKMILILLSFSTCMIVMQFAVYYTNRAVIILDTGITIWIVYCIYKILNRFNLKLVNIFSSCIIIISIVIFTYICRKIYINYNEYSVVRNAQILEQIEQTGTFVYYTYSGTLPKFSKFVCKLTDAYESNNASEEYVKYMFGYEGEYTLQWYQE